MPYDYTVQGRNRFKGLELTDSVPDELWTEVRDIVQETGIKTMPIEKKCKKAKWLSEEVLQIAVKRREAKSKFRLVQFSHSVVSDSLRPHELQYARPPCPSPTPGVHSDSCPSSQWCHPAISSSVVPSPPAPNPSQHQSLFQWVNSSYEVAKVLEFQL